MYLCLNVYVADAAAAAAADDDDDDMCLQQKFWSDGDKWIFLTQ